MQLLHRFESFPCKKMLSSSSEDRARSLPISGHHLETVSNHPKRSGRRGKLGDLEIGCPLPERQGGSYKIPAIAAGERVGCGSSGQDVGHGDTADLKPFDHDGNKRIVFGDQPIGNHLVELPDRQKVKAGD
jgi:hypothetical protein